MGFMVCSDEISYVGQATGKLLTQRVSDIKAEMHYCIIIYLNFSHIENNVIC